MDDTDGYDSADGPRLAALLIDMVSALFAAAHHVSLSHLHRLFQQDGTSVAAWIRDQRLDRARRDLVGTTSIGAIAVRWGFRDAAEFSRVFRREFGLAPREYRSAAQASGVGPRGAPRR
ncbi:helix-turn-helix transcriptional regulator [Streptacidiphilus jiangxiensis]|uniref:helix-turn-helix transcriptional regulator n=1 Tax=Streptacidiphilus jiangxiensis TaxID=235985 RepID=UPI001F2ABD4B|nr:helix-turn-helix transcriptional regulator [Streptacidiphilus jiangxiensis]